MTGLWPDGVVIRLVSPVFYSYITSNDYIFFIKIIHMKTEVLTHSANRANRAPQVARKEGTEAPDFAGKTGITILLAIAFLALVMCLSYLFIAGTR
jgi:hypothetical protein